MTHITGVVTTVQEEPERAGKVAEARFLALGGTASRHCYAWAYSELHSQKQYVLQTGDEDGHLCCRLSTSDRS